MRMTNAEYHAYKQFGKSQGGAPVVKIRKSRSRKPQAENGVVRACLDWLWTNKVKAWRMNTGAFKTEGGSWIRYGYTGCADIHGLLKPNGRHLSCECKTLDGEQSEEQKEEQRRVEASGGLYILARSTDDLERELKPLLMSPMEYRA